MSSNFDLCPDRIMVSGAIFDYRCGVAHQVRGMKNIVNARFNWKRKLRVRCG
jgi:hypothetical protein